MTHSLRHKWNKFCSAISRLFDRREKRKLFNANICPACKDERRRFVCPVCFGVKERPFSEQSRKKIRDRYLEITGVDLF